MKRLIALLAGALMLTSLGAAPASASVPDWDKAPAVREWDKAPKPLIPGKDQKGHPDRYAATAKTAKALPPSNATVYTYSGGSQGVTNTGLFSGVKFRDNYRDPGDNHNLIELSVQDGSNNIVEVGWGKGNIGCPSAAACLFVYSWVNGVGQGYGTGYTDYAGSSFNLGDTVAGTTETAGCTLPAVKNERFGIRKLTPSNAWGIWVDLCYGDSTVGQWIGEFPQSNWTSQGASFLTSDFVQVFNETPTPYVVGSSADDGYACSDQGGSLATPTSGTGMRIGDVNIQDVALGSVNLTPFIQSYNGWVDTEMVGKYGAAVLSGQPAGNARYINAGGLAFGPDGSGPLGDGNSVGGANCT